MTELQAFELFKPHGEQNFFLCARQKSIGISKDAFFAMGSPEYALVFFDDVKKRIMVKAVNQNYDNAIKIIRHSAGGTHKSSNMAFCCKGLCLKMIELFGVSNRVYGHLVSDGVMVFDKVEDACQKKRTRSL